MVRNFIRKDYIIELETKFTTDCYVSSVYQKLFIKDAYDFFQQQIFQLFLPVISIQNRYIITQMQRESLIVHNNSLTDQLYKLNLISDLTDLNKDFLLGFILKNANNIKPQLVKDLVKVLELLIDIRDCKVISKETFFQLVIVFSHVCHNLQKHNIENFMQFYEQSIDDVTNDPDYLKKKYFIHERHQGKIIKNLHEHQIKSKILKSLSIIQEKKQAIQDIKSKIQQKKPKSNISQMRIAQLVRNKSELAECPVCLVEVTYDDISVLACGHIYHKQCFEQCMKESILNKRFPLKCPVEQCTKHIQTDDVEEYLSKDLLEKYYEFTLHNFVDKNSVSMTWCPTPGCTNAFEFDEYITELNCLKCSKNYCLKCKTQSHPDRTCQQNKELMNLSQQDKEFLKFVKGAKYKQCPKCKFWVSKNKGCCHMTCRCSYEFCYVCGSKYGECNCKEDYPNYYGSPDDSEIDDSDIDDNSDSRLDEEEQMRAQIEAELDLYD